MSTCHYCNCHVYDGHFVTNGIRAKTHRKHTTPVANAPLPVRDVMLLRETQMTVAGVSRGETMGYRGFKQGNDGSQAYQAGHDIDVIEGLGEEESMRLEI